MPASEFLMKRSLTAAVATLALLACGPVLAGDLPSAKGMLPPAPPLPAFYDWSGVYLGAQAGYGWGSDRFAPVTAFGRVPLGPRAQTSPSGAFGGGHVGFNHQSGQLVFGIEADIESMNARTRYEDAALVMRQRQDWQGSVRGRLGYALDRYMVYVSAGAAFTRFEHAFSSPLTGLSETAKVSRTGWTVGAGLNHAVTENVILGLDYRYTDYGRFDQAGRGPFFGIAAEHEPSSHAMRASIAYKF